METYSQNREELLQTRRIAENEAVEKIEDAFRALNRMNQRGTGVKISSSDLIDLKRVLRRLQAAIDPVE
jgi:hypothetical protein